MKLRIQILLLLTVAAASAFSPIVFKRRGGASVTEGGGSSGTYPTNVADLAMWLRADAIVGLSDNDKVTTWEDSSASNNDATQSNAAEKPIYKTSQIDGLPAVAGYGTNWFNLNNVDFTAGEIFVVLKVENDPALDHWNGTIWRYGSSFDTEHYPYLDGIVYLSWGSTTRFTCGNPGLSLATWHLLNISSASGNWTCRTNRDIFFTSGSNSVDPNNTPTLLGDPSVVDSIARMAEVILYTNVLSGTDRTNIQNYLDNKYPSLGL